MSQQYIGYKDGRTVYKDMTAKRIKVYLQRNNVGGNDVFTPLLTGDIHAVMKQSL